MSVITSWLAHASDTQQGELSGPMALLMITLSGILLICAVDNDSDRSPRDGADFGAEIKVSIEFRKSFQPPLQAALQSVYLYFVSGKFQGWSTMDQTQIAPNAAPSVWVHMWMVPASDEQVQGIHYKQWMNVVEYDCVWMLSCSID